MKKLLGLVFGLMVSISSAMAGTCNLLDTPAIYTNATWDAQTGTVTNTKTDTRFPLSYTIQLVSSSANGTGPAANGTATSFSGPITYTKTFTTSSDTHWLRFYTSGQDTNIATLAFPCEPNTTYTFSMDVVSVDPTTVGGVVYTHMQLEKGTTATAYVPYDPNCNPCPSGQVLHTYTSATGTVSQSPAPTPDHPVNPTFYTQDNMVLRKINATYYDSYDATTGKITRRVGVKVLNGTEDWEYVATTYPYFRMITDIHYSELDYYNNELCSHFPTGKVPGQTFQGIALALRTTDLPLYVFFRYDSLIQTTTDNVSQLKQWLAQQAANGTPVTVYYPLETPVEEDWAAEQCSVTNPIKIATTKYNDARFNPVVTTLNTAIAKIKDVVSTTIEQTKAVASLQSEKQQRPADADCPAGKKCLLVEDSNGIPHWYEIVESYYNPRLPAGFTELAYLESTGTQWIDTGYVINSSNYKKEVTLGYWYGNNGKGNNGVAFGSMGSGHRSPFLQNNYNVEQDIWRVGVGENPGAYSTYYVTPAPQNGQSTVVLKQDGNTFYYGNSENSLHSTSIDYSITLSGINEILFAVNDNGTAKFFAPVKMYSYKLWVDNSIVRDLIPARRESDGVVGMFDLANNQFYTNRGTGEFTAGPVVLPDGYTTLQYIESTGTQYIDTGYGFDKSIKFDITFTKTGNNVGDIEGGRSTVVFGSNSNTGSECMVGWNGNNYLRGSSSSSFTPTVGTKYNLVGDFTLGANKIIVDGVQKGSTSSSTNTNKGHLFLFGVLTTTAPQASSLPTTFTQQKVYGCKVWYDENLVRNMIPAKNSSNVVGMYDTVSGQFFTNAGTGTFTAGDVAQ